MSILIILTLVYFYAISIAALPIIAPASLWDMQRSTNFKLIHDAAMAKYALDTHSSVEPTVVEIKLTPTDPAKMIKKRVARRGIKVTHAADMKSVPMPGMQCTVM